MFGFTKPKAKIAKKSNKKTTDKVVEEACTCPGRPRSCAKTDRNSMTIYSCTCCTACRAKCTH